MVYSQRKIQAQLTLECNPSCVRSSGLFIVVFLMAALGMVSIVRADWHRGLDCRGWVMLPRHDTLMRILGGLKKSLEKAAAVAPWLKKVCRS